MADIRPGVGFESRGGRSPGSHRPHSSQGQRSKRPDYRGPAAVAGGQIHDFAVADGRLFSAVSELCPRNDRTAERRVFEGVTANRLRTAITRACTASGVPAFSPHDLRHRRATLWHLGGAPAAQASSWLGHSAQEHLRCTRHAEELDYSSWSPTLLGETSV